MRAYLILTLVLISIVTKAQFTEILSNTSPLTPHWKNLAVPAIPAFLGGQYYLKLDDKTFISTNGNPGGTVQLQGFTDIPKIADYVATSKYLYYSVYKEGKVFLNRFDPITQQHTPVKNSSKIFAEHEESVLVYSVFQNKLVVSCWYYDRSASRTYVYLYAIHDKDPSANAFLLAASVNQDGILDGPVGHSDEQITAIYKIKKTGFEDKNVIYAFGINDSLKGNYTVKKNYDFTEIGLLINSVVGFGNDVLFVLNNKKKIDAKEAGATSIWLLRNKSAKKLADLQAVKSNSLSRTYRSGEWLFLQFAEGVYSFNTRTGLLKNVIALQANESLGYLTPSDGLQLRGDTLWCRVGTKLPDGNTKYQLTWVKLSKPEIRQLVPGMPSHLISGYWFEKRSLQYPFLNGNRVYYCDEFSSMGAQFFQYSLLTGQSAKIVPPSTSTAQYECVTEIIPIGSTLLVKAMYKAGKGKITKTFLYKM